MLIPRLLVLICPVLLLTPLTLTNWKLLWLRAVLLPMLLPTLRRLALMLLLMLTH
jgi:hypothetical protein